MAGQLWAKPLIQMLLLAMVAMAYRCGSRCERHGVYSIPPYSTCDENGRPFLITEALRGEGGVILDDEGLGKWNTDCEQSLTNGLERPKPGIFIYSTIFESWTWQQEILLQERLTKT